MKKLLPAIVCAVLMVCIIFISYWQEYAITGDKKQLARNIKEFVNKPAVIAKNIDIKQQLNIDNKKYVLFLINNESLGEAELTKGINNRYKIESVGEGGSCFSNEICKTSKGKYLILKGKNSDGKIVYAKVTLDNKKYKINVPQQEYFLTYCAVPAKTQIQCTDTRPFDKNDVDISSEIQ